RVLGVGVQDHCGDLVLEPDFLIGCVSACWSVALLAGDDLESSAGGGHCRCTFYPPIRTGAIFAYRSLYRTRGPASYREYSSDVKTPFSISSCANAPVSTIAEFTPTRRCFGSQPAADADVRSS